MTSDPYRSAPPPADAAPTLEHLIVDAYEGDSERKKLDWFALAAAGDPWRGVILKATQGTYYNGGGWFSGQWKLVQLAGVHANRGQQWRRGAYHYFDIRQNPTAQRDYFLATIKRAGGLDERDILMVDVERASQRGPVSGAQVVSAVSTFVEGIKAATGHWVMLYGGSWLYELNVTSRMGCRYLAIARYTKDLPPPVFQRIGWSEDLVALWQYSGVDGAGNAESLRFGYPVRAPGCGVVDISSVRLPGGADAIGAP